MEGEVVLNKSKITFKGKNIMSKIRLGLLVFLITVFATISAYTQEEAKPELTARQWEVKFDAAESMFKDQKTALERTISKLVKEKEEQSKTLNSNRLEIDKLKVENEKLKREIESAKPKEPVAVKERPKPTYRDLKFRNWAASGSYNVEPSKVFPELVKLVNTIQVTNGAIQNKDGTYTGVDGGCDTYWVASKKEITMGFGGKGGSITFNIDDANQKSINDRFKVLPKHSAPGCVIYVTEDKLNLQSEFPNPTDPIDCTYKENSESKPVKMKLQIQHHYISKVLLGHGILMIMIVSPENGFTKNEEIIYIVSMIETTNIQNLQTEISKYYDVDTTPLSSDTAAKYKAINEERRKEKGLKTFAEVQKELEEEKAKIKAAKAKEKEESEIK